MANKAGFYSEINKLRKKGESDRAFGIRMGVHPSMLRYWKKGMRPRGDTVEKILSKLHMTWEQACTLANLATTEVNTDTAWRGPPSTPPPPHREPEKQECLPVASEPVKMEREKRSSNEFVCVPSVASVCPDKELAVIDNNHWFMFRRDWIASLVSNSDQLVTEMIWENDMSPTLIPGDIVLIDMGFFVPREGGIYALINDEHVITRRFKFQPGGLAEFTADGDRSKTLSGPLASFEIVGRIIWVGRSLV